MKRTIFYEGLLLSLPLSLPLSSPHHRIVNIITVRRGGNLDRCKTTRAVLDVPSAYRMRVYICVRL